MTNDLIERLRNCADAAVQERASYLADALDEAVACITTLEAKLAVAREALKDARSQIIALASESDVPDSVTQALKGIEQ